MCLLCPTKGEEDSWFLLRSFFLNSRHNPKEAQLGKGNVEHTKVHLIAHLFSSSSISIWHNNNNVDVIIANAYWRYFPSTAQSTLRVLPHLIHNDQETKL